MVPDADLWQQVGPELERPRWENSRLVRNVSRPSLTVPLMYPNDPALATIDLEYLFGPAFAGSRLRLNSWLG